MDDSEGVRIENLCDDLYSSILELVSVLMALDPAEDTPLGRLLIGMATAMEAYEKEKFPAL